MLPKKDTLDSISESKEFQCRRCFGVNAGGILQQKLKQPGID